MAARPGAEAETAGRPPAAVLHRVDTVHPPGLPQGKGYQKVHFEDAWAAYCPGQNMPPAQSSTSEAYIRTNADEMGATGDFRSVQKDLPYGSKNGKLSYGHAGLYGCTDRKPQNGGEGCSDREKAHDDYPDFPASLRRCDHCGQPGTGADPLHSWDWPGRPDGIRLHNRCENPWFDAEGTTA
jgi:hypothetical protein